MLLHSFMNRLVGTSKFFRRQKEAERDKAKKKTTYLIFYFLCDCLMDILIRTLFTSAEIKGDI
jgi:hypothetical protein